MLHALLVLAAPSVLQAQQAERRLSLDEALQLAREGNPALQRARADAGPAGVALRAAWAAAYLPGVTGSLGFSGSERTSVTGEDPFGHVVRLPASRTSRGSSASQSLGASMTLFDGLASTRGLRAQRSEVDGVMAAIAAQEVQLTAQVSREYYHAVRTMRLIRLEDALLASARERLLTVEALLRLAARSRMDVLGAQADVAQSEQAVERARGEADKARLALAATLGMDPSTPLAVDTLLPPVFDPALLDPATLVTRALHASPSVQQREAALAGTHHRAGAARARRWPTVTGSFGYNRSVNQTGFGAFGELNPLNYGHSFGISASLPVFNRFQTAAAVANAEAAVQRAEHDLRAARLNLERDVRSALIDLRNAYRSLQLAEQNAALSRERQELTQEQYRLGGINFTELQNVIDRTAQAERQALDARFQFISARLALEEKLGTRLED
jgi:outer membrane protein